MRSFFLRATFFFIASVGIASGDEQQTVYELLDDFSDETTLSQIVVPVHQSRAITGSITAEAAYAIHNEAPHSDISSLKSTLYLAYEQKFTKRFDVRINAKAYYDAIYDLKGNEKFTQDERDALRREIELFDCYIQGGLSQNIDIKLGRQIIVWGRSDTIRITDVLNPLDARRPGMVDIEDLRLPVTMGKIDYYFNGHWNISPIVILEQRFSKNPPYGSDFYPLSVARPDDEGYAGITYALSLKGEFSGWDFSYYYANVRDDAGFIAPNQHHFQHNKIQMHGLALNMISGPLLWKTELAYFRGLRYSSMPERDFNSLKILGGFDYSVFADTRINYDFAYGTVLNYDQKLTAELIPREKREYQHALRISSEFLHARLIANYLGMFEGLKLQNGGFHRSWLEYKISGDTAMSVGGIFYIGGSVLYDAIDNNDMLFMNITYSF